MFIIYFLVLFNQVPSFPDWFNVVYDQDSSVYTYHQLPGDEDRGDLQILVLQPIKVL